MSIRHRAAGAGFVAALAVAGLAGRAAQSPADSEPIDLGALEWRHLGPIAGGPTNGLAGHRADARVLYAATPGGGLWTTTDYGHRWQPLFDRQTTGVVESVATAPSDPRVLYAGTGPAPGMAGRPGSAALYKSADRGATWTPAGFTANGRIARIVVHPADPNRVTIAVLSQDEGDNVAGLHRSVDGGRTFDRVLAGDAATNAMEIAVDLRDPARTYAARWQASSPGATNALSSGIFRSTDEGTTWQPVSGLPTGLADGLGITSLAVAAAPPGRVFANVHARSRGGLYRSDDAGVTWTLVSDEARLAGAAIAADPVNADILYAAGATALRSEDGGRRWTTWRAGRGAPYRAVWIHPAEPGVAALASDEGVFVTVNGGASWIGGGPPAAAFSQVVADHAFPYRVCAGQPTGRVVCVPSRGGTARTEWLGGPLDRSGYLAVDPTDADLIFVGELGRYDRRSGQWLDISPPGRPASSPAAALPLLFPPGNPRALYFAADALWTSSTGGQQWTSIGPNLAQAGAPSSPGAGGGLQPAAEVGAITALSVSAIDPRVIWIGTEAGRIQVTRDRGATWSDVTPPPASVVSAGTAAVRRLEASYFDTNTAYVVLAERRTGRSALMRTRTAGATWVDLSAGLPAGAVDVVREDSARRGLLFAAGNRSVWFSFDDGEAWQSLQLNLPPAPVRDLVVKDADLIAATTGRGLWVLDDISPLRQITPDVWRAPAFLFRPPTAWRTRMAAADPARDSADAVQAAPEGVAITYRLGEEASAVSVEIVDGPAGEVVRRYAAGLPDSPPTEPGLHRIEWDLRHTPPEAAWIEGGAAQRVTRGRWALPGTYQIRLIRGKSTLRQAVLVRVDPRVRATAADLAVQTKLTRAIEERLADLSDRHEAVRQRQSSLLPGPGGATGDLLALLQTSGGKLADLFAILQSADARPTTATEAAVTDALAEAARVVEQAQ
jgi:hypothetical protein